MFVKRIIKYFTRVNHITGEIEVTEGESIDEPIEEFDQPICTVREEIVEVPSEEEGRKRFVKKIVRTYIKVNPVTGEMEVVKKPFIKAKEQTAEGPSEVKTRNVKKIIRYRINPATGEREVINELESDEVSEETVILIREELPEVPSSEPGKRCFVKRVYKYITKINPITGEKQVTKEQPYDESIEQNSDKPIVVIREEVAEVPSEGSSRKSFVKRIIRYLVKINYVTGEKEIIGKQVYEEPIISFKEETVEVPTEEINNNYSKKITRYRVNPVTGEKEVIDETEISEGNEYSEREVVEESEQAVEQTQGPITSVREEVVEVPDESGRKRLVKRITKQIIRVNPKTGEREVVGEQTSEEPFEDLTKQVSTIVEEIIEAPYSEPDKKRFMKRTIKYTIEVNPVTGEKEIVGTQQVEKPIQQDLKEPISTIKEEIIELPTDSGKNVFVKRIIKYLITIDPVTGEKKVVSRKTSDEPIEELLSLNDINLTSYTRERVLSDEDSIEYDNDEFNEGQSIIGKLKRLTRQEEKPLGPIDDTIEDDSYSGKELIDRIKSALVMEDVETKDVSDMDIHIDPSISNQETRENMENIILKNYKEYEDFVDNDEKVNEVVEREVVEDKINEQNKKLPVSENKVITTDKKQVKDDDDEYDLYSVETTTTTVISGAEDSKTNYFGKGNEKGSDKDKDCVIM